MHDKEMIDGRHNKFFLLLFVYTCSSSIREGYIVMIVKRVFYSNKIELC